MATLSKKSESCVWVSVIAVFMNDTILRTTEVL